MGTQLQLEFRNATAEVWQPALRALPAARFPLFMNHARNAHLACHAIVERFVEEARVLESTEQVTSLVSHALLRNIVRSAGGESGSRFRILAREPSGEVEQIYESDPIGDR